MAFALSLPVITTKAHHAVCLKAPVLPRLRHGKAVRRQILTAPSARAKDQDSVVVQANVWSRTVEFVTTQAPKFMAALMVAAMLVRIRDSDCSWVGTRLDSRVQQPEVQTMSFVYLSAFPGAVSVGTFRLSPCFLGTHSI